MTAATSHAEFAAKVPHPELHGGKKAKQIWARIEDEKLKDLKTVQDVVNFVSKGI